MLRVTSAFIFTTKNNALLYVIQYDAQYSYVTSMREISNIKNTDMKNSLAYNREIKHVMCIIHTSFKI
jgi:predicted membrane-bound mannosyltransferase